MNLITGIYFECFAVICEIMTWTYQTEEIHNNLESTTTNDIVSLQAYLYVSVYTAEGPRHCGWIDSGNLFYYRKKPNA